MAPKGSPGQGACPRRHPPPLPRLFPRELLSVPGAGRSRGSRGSGGGGEWWQASSDESWPTEPGVDVLRPAWRLSPLPTGAPRAARNRTGLTSLLPSPVLLAGAPGAPDNQRPEDCWGGTARVAKDAVGALLGESLSLRFRQFLRQLGAEWVEQRQPPTSSESQLPRGVSEHGWAPSPQCPHCFFRPDLRGQSSNSQNSLKKILLHQIPPLRPLRKGERFTEVQKANRRRGLQAPRLEATLSHSSSGYSSSGHRQRCPPFRVRFADETLLDTALRYRERGRAVQQGIAENRPATQPAASERVFRSIGRWLESLPKALHSRAEEEAVAGCPFSGGCPSLPIPEPQSQRSEDPSLSTRLPFAPRAATLRQQREQRRDLKPLPGARSILDQVLPRLEPHRL